MTATRQPRSYSPQQQAVIDFIDTGSGSAFVQARAGTGKTTTLIGALDKAKGSVAFCAYNRKIADEIKARTKDMNLGNRVRIGTFHSFGLNTWRFVHKGVQAGPEAARKKNDMLVAQMQIPRQLEQFVLKLVSLAKQSALGLYGSIDDESFWYGVIDHHDLAHEIEDDRLIAQGVELAIRTLRASIELAPTIIDFDDMIYMPVVSNVRVWHNDVVLVDEAQDTNAARRAYVRKMLNPRSGRAIFVGDDRQAIYGFTGADSDAIDQIIKDFNCKLLPLNVTYRCPKAVVEEANALVPDIQAHETAPQGEVRSMPRGDLLKPEAALTAQDAILCRNTKPLVETAYQLIRQGTPCHVEGRDIGAGLIKLVSRYRTNNIHVLRDKLAAYGEAQCERLKAKGRETQAEALMDRIETIFVIIDSGKSHTVEELKLQVSSMFVDSDEMAKPTLTLSTVHKSKGREWQRVFILGRHEYMPSKWARQAWQLTQEDNLIYVAITRAQKELIYAE